MRIVSVDLGDRSYPIYVRSHSLDLIPDLIQKHELEQRLFIITDENVNRLYGEKVETDLVGRGLRAERIVVPPGERSKSLEQAQEIYTRLLQRQADRKAVIIALGGGVVGDLAGFIAATFMRGVPYVQVPTTILSQVDSSVGGKVGVNHPLGKNLIGAFYQPQFVLIDPETLRTLPEREIRAGLAEVIKYGFIRDAGFYEKFAKHSNALFSLADFSLLEESLRKSCAIKADVVSQDEKESGLRAILNFGHTIGHAIEAVSGYGELLHGEAIVHGMVAALHLSRTCINQQMDIEAALNLLAHFEPPKLPAAITFEALQRAMMKDKKRSSSGQLWVLLEDIGRARLTRKVSEEQVKEAVHFLQEWDKRR